MNNTEKKIDEVSGEANQLETPNNPEIILNSEKKGLAAISEIERRVKLDESIEENLSAGLNSNKNFIKKYKIVGDKRVLVIELLKDKIKKIIKNNPEPFVFDELAMQAMKDLEAELNDPFTRLAYNNLSEANKRILLDHLVDNPVHPDETKIINNANADDVINIVSEANDNVVSYSDNGYLIKLENKNNLKSDTKVNDKECLFSLISPDGKALAQRIDYASAMMLLEEQSENYHQKLKEDFNATKTETKNEPNLELPQEALEVSNLELEKEEAPVLIEEKKEEETQLFVNPFNEKVSKYAESIGIKPEELASNPEFLNLSPEQQQFALETLRRTSLAKAKVEAHESFVEEKASKKWWQIGFAINQNYHKERHKIEAVKNIEKGGLEAYGKEDLQWLTDIIKNGPEIKANEQGDVVVNFLKEADFNEEEKDRIAEYNQIAREYIEYKPKKGEPDARREMANLLDDIYREITGRAQTYSENDKLNELFIKSRNNIELLRFLSADKETEIALNKLAETSTEGFDRIKGIALGQADKAGYSALGFAIRSGSKFALANSAVFASALSYSVAPMAAAIVGGFRAYNKGKNELKEKEELAKLGVEDKSGLLRGKNLATGKEEKDGQIINFGLKEKLETLVEQAKNNNLSEEEYRAIIEKLITRIRYTELKMNREEIDYGSIGERNINYSNLVQIISEAKSVVGLHRFYNLHRQHRHINSDFDVNAYSAFAGVNTYDSKIKIPERLENESLDNYKARLAQDKNFVKYQAWATDEKRLEKLGEAGLELRLNSFLKYQEQKQTKKENKFLVKKVVSGALMGAGFAAVGAFVAEHLNAGAWFSHESNGGTNTAEVSAAMPLKEVIVEEVEISEPVNNTTTIPVKSESVIEVPQENKIVTPEKIITREPEFEMEKIEAKPVELVIEEPAVDPQTISINAPSESVINNIQETNISTTETTPEEIVEIEEIKIPVEEVVEPVAEAPVEITPSNTETTEVISQEVEEVVEPVAEAPVEITPSNTETTEVISQEVVDAKQAAVVMKEIIDTSNKASKLADGVYSNKPDFSSEDGFIKQVAEINNVKLSPEQELEAKTIYGSFKNNNDYNLLKRRLISFEDKISSQSVVETQVVNEVVNPVERIADTSAIAGELHVEPESLKQVGEDLVYQGKESSSVVFDLKQGGIKEVVDVKGKKIPNEFVKELIGKTKMSKFTRDGGLEKIFTTWNRLDSNDKLIYESLSWFNSGKFAPSDLISQVKSLYQVNTENVYIDSSSKQFVTVSGKTFDMTLKGIKKLIAYLPKK